MPSLKESLQRYLHLKTEVAKTENLKNPKLYKELITEFNALEEYVPLYQQHLAKEAAVVELQGMLKQEKDPEMAKEIKSEIVAEEQASKSLINEIQRRLVASEDNVPKILMEIRAGTGGEEACLFAADIYRMYVRYLENKNWHSEIVSMSESGRGIKEVVFSVEGKEAYVLLRNEVGTHRVQRIPETESQGRIHTSAITVAVLPFIEEAKLEIKDADIRIDTYRASGAGGQHVNTTDSAIRITHLSTGLVVTCQEERSQLKNKEKALKLLRARLYQHRQEERKRNETEMRKSQVGSGDRSEKIRTYNFPQARVSDHRIGYTSHNLTGILNGDLEDMLRMLEKYAIELKLKGLSV